MSYLEIVAASLFLFITNTKQDDIGYFWHLTDIHCDLHYVNKSCNLPYGNYSCDSSPNLALSAISATRELFAKKPDFVIWSGDNGPHDDSVSSEQLLDGIRLLSKAMKQAFPIDEVYILPVLGNHDVIPANNMEVTLNSRSRTTWCHKLGDDLQLWGEWINHPQKHLTSPVSLQSSSNFPRANFSQTCFFSHHLVNIGAYNQYDYDQRMNSTRRTNLILISLNGLIWYQGNILANDEDHDPLGQLDWLQKTFQWQGNKKRRFFL
ncbi:unnamed protein product [Heterobilharzia americana]|nr:unnamed protein product [Heterobilharzia americana]